MIWKLTIVAMLLVAATALVTSQAVSQEQPSDAQMEEAMRKMMEMATPGTEHALLRKRVGNWTTTYRMWMGGPGSPAMESTGKSEITSILGGRWIMEKTSGDMMGMPHEGFGLTGYDNFRKQFRTIWIDNMSTTIYAFNGHLDKTGKIITTYGEMDEPMTGHIAKMARFVTKFVSDDEFVISAYDIVLGDDAKVMEITYKRVK